MEEKKKVEFEELPPEKQEDVLRELEEAISRYRDLEAGLWETDAIISENVTRLREAASTLEREASEIRAMPRGPERAARARAHVTAIRNLSEAEVNQARAYREYLRNFRELDKSRERLDELRGRARMV